MAAAAAGGAAAAADIDLEAEILGRLSTRETIDTNALAAELNVPHQDVVGALKSLECGEFVVSAKKELMVWKLTPEGVRTAENGSPEAALWALLGTGEVDQRDAKAALGDEAFQIALNNAMKSKLLKVTKAEGVVKMSRNPAIATFTDDVKAILAVAQKNGELDKAATEMLKKRQLASYEAMKVFTISKGPAYAPHRERPEADITREMLLDKSWATKTFKPYNLRTASGRAPLGGQLHPLLKVRQEFREIFLELGFMEMDTSNWVESSFWNFDTLFVGQNHPARDSQDTFFVSKPEMSKPVDADYLQRVRETHERGYLSAWDPVQSRRNVLRTHTTAVSSFVLNALAQSQVTGLDGLKTFRPGKYFSIDRVFRNEEMDKTHLCEFHQIEGFVVDRNLSLANMMHVLHQFFKKIGVEKLRFKPTYNPYTEPSMEIFGWHNGFNKWVEVGNSGLFRPEMLKPMGFADDVTAIAWGLSLERPTMIKYGIKNIHELFGHKVDINFVRRSPICRF